jgi:hypothetical protein
VTSIAQVDLGSFPSAWQMMEAAEVCVFILVVLVDDAA